LGQPSRVQQIPTDLYKQTMVDMSHIVNKNASNKLSEPPSLYMFIGITFVLILIGWIISEIANWHEIHNNWDKYKCIPSITAFSKFYGYDLNETMNFCIGEAVKNNSAGVIVPLYKGIDTISKTVEGVYDKASAIEGGIKSLLSGFTTFLTNFANSFRLIGTRIRVSLIKIRDIFDKVFGMFTSFALAGVTAITFGQNLMCNPLVTFIGTIAGVDVCCFAPGTLVNMSSGTKAIETVSIGDMLADGSIVTSTLEFHGLETSMVRINGIHVSGNHYLLESGTFVEAKNHPEAVKAESVPLIFCLNTTSNRIPIGSNIFTDYDETSEPTVIRAAKTAAEIELNGSSRPSSDDYSLGIDPRARVGNKKIEDLRIGDTVNESRVIGIITELCSDCCKSPGGIILSINQLIYNGSWTRAEFIFPRIFGVYTLKNVILSNNEPLYLQNKEETECLITRDYMEVHSTSVQEPYDNWLTSSLPES